MWSALGAVGSSLLGGIFGSSGARKQNKAQIQMSREQMDFQERMSNTAHQREMEDLRKAGLNPILSAKLGGASSPGGAMPNIVNEMAPMQNAAQSMGDKLFAFRVQDAQVDNMRLQNDLLKEQVEQLQISNARQGLLTPAYELGGSLVDKIAAGVKNLGSGDIVQDVLEAGQKAATGVTDGPSSAANFKSRWEAPVGTSDSEARKFARGDKSFIQSLKDANRNRATEEQLQRYGIRRLEEMKRKNGDWFQWRWHRK